VSKKKLIDQFKEEVVPEKSCPESNQLLQRALSTGQEDESHNINKGHGFANKHLASKYEMLPVEGLHHLKKWLAEPFECVAILKYYEGRAPYGKRFRFSGVSHTQKEIDIPFEFFKGDGTPVESILLHNLIEHSRAKGDIRRLIQYMSQIDPGLEVLIYDKTGWHGDRFIFPHAAVDCKGIYDESGFIGDKDSANYGSSGTLEEWKTSVAKPCEKNSRLAFSLLLALAAPLLKRLGMDSFGVHYYGSSSIGKTSALKIASSVFGSADKYPLTWRATSNALECVAVSHNDTLLVLDEIGQAANDLGETVYMLFNGQGKSRSKKEGGLRNKLTWRLIGLSSGELTLEQHAQENSGKLSRAGQEVRFLNVAADAGKGLGIFDDLGRNQSPEQLLRDLSLAINDHYGVAGQKFIQGILVRKNDILTNGKRKLDEYAKRLTSELKKPCGQVLRVAKQLAFLVYAGELAISCEVLPFENSIPFEACQRIFRDWIKARGGEGELEDKSILEQLLEQMETHPEKFANERDRYSSKESWGIIDNDCIHYLTPGGLKKIFKGFDKQTAKRILLKHGVISDTQALNKTVFTYSVRVFELNLDNLHKAIAIM
jgi:uncharacterized protein (DUF927 family)